MYDLLFVISDKMSNEDKIDENSYVDLVYLLKDNQKSSLRDFYSFTAKIHRLR